MAVLWSDHIGGFVVASLLSAGYGSATPDLALDFFGGEGTRELEEARPLIDARCSLFGSPRAIEELPGLRRAPHTWKKAATASR